MGKTKANPRYNIVSVRIDDHLRAELTNQLSGRGLSGYLRDALEEKMVRDRQMAFDEHIRASVS